jgi:hypothetical protein
MSTVWRPLRVDDGFGRDALGEGLDRLVGSAFSPLEEAEPFFLEDSDPFELSFDVLSFDVPSLDFLPALGATRSDIEGCFLSFASFVLPVLTPSRKSESLSASQSEPL